MSKEKIMEEFENRFSVIYLDGSGFTLYVSKEGRLMSDFISEIVDTVKQETLDERKTCCCISYERGVYPCMCGCHSKELTVEGFYEKFGSRLPCMTSGTRSRIETWFEQKLADELVRERKELAEKYKKQILGKYKEHNVK